MTRIRTVIVGVGNCASALIQGIEYYRTRSDAEHVGLMHANIGGYRSSDLEIVAAFDIDLRKLGTPLEEAVFAPPNYARSSRPNCPRVASKSRWGLSRCRRCDGQLCAGIHRIRHGYG